MGKFGSFDACTKRKLTYHPLAKGIIPRLFGVWEIQPDDMAAAAMVNITFITITSYQYLPSVPGYEAGIEYIHNRTKNQIHINFLPYFRKDIVSCDLMGDYQALLSAEYFYKRRPPGTLAVFLAPRKCSTWVTDPQSSNSFLWIRENSVTFLVVFLNHSRTALRS